MRRGTLRKGIRHSISNLTFVMTNALTRNDKVDWRLLLNIKRGPCHNSSKMYGSFCVKCEWTWKNGRRVICIEVFELVLSKKNAK